MSINRWLIIDIRQGNSVAVPQTEGCADRYLARRPKQTWLKKVNVTGELEE